MIYMNAPDQKITFTQPIKIAVPTNYLQKGMQLYQGEMNNGKINWTAATPFRNNKQLASIDSGKILFEQKCASCHAIGRELTGPDLAHFPKRFPYGEETARYWHHEFKDRYTTDTINELISKDLDSSFGRQSNDPYACNLIHLYGSVAPPLNLSRQELNDIYNFIQNESDRRNLPLPSHAYLKDCTDSCIYYNKKLKNLKKKKI